MTGRWSGSTRRAQLPADWPKRRARILRRDDHRCTWIEDDGMRCARPATDVDHIDRHGDDTDNNLRSLCNFHHRKKTSAEGHAAKPPRRRPTEPHPGLKGGG